MNEDLEEASDEKSMRGFWRGAHHMLSLDLLNEL
jgi:hypothetical protein